MSLREAEHSKLVRLHIMICELVGGSQKKDSEGWRENVLSRIVSSNSTDGNIIALGCPHLLDGRGIHRSRVGSESLRRAIG